MPARNHITYCYVDSFLQKFYRQVIAAIQNKGADSEWVDPKNEANAIALRTPRQERRQTLIKLRPQAILPDIYPETNTMSSSQKRAIQTYRSRLSARGLTRFEVLGRGNDRDLIRSLARRLAEEGPEASRLRAAVSQTISGAPAKKGGILAALRRSPLVGADLDLSRTREEGRKVEI